jgi:hypothetical protein
VSLDEKSPSHELWIGDATEPPTTLESQSLPQNQWRIHPIIDGCEPVVIV